MERYPLEQVSKWRRINNLLKRVDNLLEIEQEIMEGNEWAIKDYIKSNSETRAMLVEKAKKINVKNYGKMTKGELINAIKKYERDQISRQKYER